MKQSPAQTKPVGRPAKARGKSRTTRISFVATLLRPPLPGGTDRPAESWTFLTLPNEASRKLPSRGMVAVSGTFNNSPFRATLEPDGNGGHWLKVERALRKAAGAEVGDRVALEITPLGAGEEPEPTVPADLRKALAAAPSAKAAWSDITPAARRDWIQWITSGKRAQTRPLRIGKACDMLAKGKRRPCCFDRSGMYDGGRSCPVPDATPRPTRR